MTGIEDHRTTTLREIVADDRLIDAIAGDVTPGLPPLDDGAGRRLAALLVAWRRHELIVS
jgi:hypothetical protein